VQKVSTHNKMLLSLFIRGLDCTTTTCCVGV